MKIAKVKSYLFNFPSQLSPILYKDVYYKANYFISCLINLSGQVLNVTLSGELSVKIKEANQGCFADL